jgi:Telomeric repeat-binding factor 2.
MKKLWTILAGVCLLASLSGCGAAAPGSASQSSAASAEAAASASASASAESAGETDGFLGDTMSTAFFDFSVDSAKVCASADGYTAAAGNQLVVVTMHIQNTATYSMPMYNNDFQLQWGDGDSDFGYPAAGSLCTDYEIPINGSKDGDLVFEVPQGTKDYSVAFQEYYENDEAGDSFFVYFTATADSAATAAAKA